MSSKCAADVALTHTVPPVSPWDFSLPDTMKRVFVVSTCLMAYVAWSVQSTASCSALPLIVTLYTHR